MDTKRRIIMKAVVNKAFIDNETQTGYNEGSIYENDNEERFIYLQNKEFLDLSKHPDLFIQAII